MLSLITINYNNDAGLKRTLESVRKQVTDCDFEHIVIDGASNDRSLDIIENYKFVARRVIVKSEKDSGIYDAMNKGLKLALGSHVAFLNSGDVLTHNLVLNKISSAIAYDEIVDFIYGDICFIDGVGRLTRTWRAGPYVRKKLYYGWMSPHPMTTIRKSILTELGGFEETLKIAADYDLMLKTLLRPHTVVNYIPDTIVSMELGGISNGSVRGIIKANYEVLKSWFRIKGFVCPYWVVLTKPLAKIFQLKGRI